MRMHEHRHTHTHTHTHNYPGFIGIWIALWWNNSMKTRKWGIVITCFLVFSEIFRWKWKWMGKTMSPHSLLKQFLRSPEDFSISKERACVLLEWAWGQEGRWHAMSLKCIFLHLRGCVWAVLLHRHMLIKVIGRQQCGNTGGNIYQRVYQCLSTYM